MRHTFVLIAVVLGGIINYSAFGSTGWTGMGNVIAFGIFPLLALAVAGLIGMLISSASKMQKLITAIAVAYSILGTYIAIQMAPKQIAPLFPAGIWLAPLLAWYFTTLLFSRRRHDSHAEDV